MSERDGFSAHSSGGCLFPLVCRAPPPLNLPSCKTQVHRASLASWILTVYPSRPTPLFSTVKNSSSTLRESSRARWRTWMYSGETGSRGSCLESERERLEEFIDSIHYSRPVCGILSIGRTMFCARWMLIQTQLLRQRI